MGEVEYIKQFNAIHAEFDEKIHEADGDAKKVAAALEAFRAATRKLESQYKWD